MDRKVLKDLKTIIIIKTKDMVKAIHIYLCEQVSKGGYFLQLLHEYGDNEEWNDGDTEDMLEGEEWFQSLSSAHSLFENDLIDKYAFGTIQRKITRKYKEEITEFYNSSVKAVRNANKKYEKYTDWILKHWLQI